MCWEFSAVPPQILYRRHTYICFVENQLALGQIGISPLPKTLRRIMQHSPVRSIIIWSWEDHLMEVKFILQLIYSFDLPLFIPSLIVRLRRNLNLQLLSVIHRSLVLLLYTNLSGENPFVLYQ